MAFTSDVGWMVATVPAMCNVVTSRTSELVMIDMEYMTGLTSVDFHGTRNGLKTGY